MLLFSVIKIVLGVFIGFGVLLLFVQNSLIYHPSSYEPGVVDEYVAGGVVRLTFETSEGQQSAYWYRPSEESPSIPQTTWLVFGGNASRALVWVDFLKLFRGSNVGFLLIDYPGYGECNGSPSPDSVLENTSGALGALCSHFNWDEKTVTPTLAMLGHSLGAAAALQAAQHYSVTRIVLASPFTSLQDMAKRTVSPVYAPLVRHRWDNVARLKELEAISNVRVAVIHGIEDREIPVRMSRELAKRFPKMITLEEVPELGHNDLFYGAAAKILEPIQELSSALP